MSSEYSDEASVNLGVSSCRPVSPSMVAEPHSYSRDTCDKVLKGQLLKGLHSIYDIDKQTHNDFSSHNVEALPISFHGWDPTFVTGRQIAVNRRYICYCLQPGSIRILSRNAAAWSLFDAHPEKVTDIAFFGENIHVIASASSDGSVFVWKILEDIDADGRVQLCNQILLGMHFDVELTNAYPCVCWHPSSQACLLLCISKYVLKLDLNELKQTSLFSGSPVHCPIMHLIPGVHLIGEHGDDVTYLSTLVREAFYIAASSKDGTVHVWMDGRTSPLAVFIPHDGLPVSSVFFLDMPNKHEQATVLLTGGHLNSNLKLWVPSNSNRCLEGIWISMQALDLKSSTLGDSAFCNQICVVPQAGLVFLGNSKRPALYSIHLKCGGSFKEMRMDYIVEFAMSMPILSLTATTDIQTDPKGIVQVFCVQTQAIQEYFFDVSICLPSYQESTSNVIPASGQVGLLEPHSTKEVEKGVQGKERTTKSNDRTECGLGNHSLIGEHNSGSGFGSWVEVPNWLVATIKTSRKLGPTKKLDEQPSGFLNARPSLSPKLCNSRCQVEKPSNMVSGDIVYCEIGENIMPHLVTPSELATVAKFEDASIKANKEEVEETAKLFEKLDIIPEQSTSATWNQQACQSAFVPSPSGAACVPSSEVAPFDTVKLVEEEDVVSLSVKCGTSAKKKKSKNKNRDRYVVDQADQASTSVASYMLENGAMKLANAEQEENTVCEPAIIDVATNISDIQATLNQLLVLQQEMKHSFPAAVSAQFATEDQCTSANLEHGLSKSLTDLLDPLCTKLNDANEVIEAFEHESYEGLVGMIKDHTRKEIISSFQQLLKREFTSLEDTITQSQSSHLEGVLASILPRSLEALYQKRLKLLEKTLIEQIDTVISQFLQRNLVIGEEFVQNECHSQFQGLALVSIDNFVQKFLEQVCLLMQEDLVGSVTVDGQLSAAIAIAQTIKDTLCPPLLVASSLKEGMTDMEHKLFLRGQKALVDLQYDIGTDLMGLLKAGNYEDAFQLALLSGDTNIVFSACKQVDPRAMLSSMPPPLTQGVLVSLLQHLVKNVGNDRDTTSLSNLERLLWIEQVILFVDATYMRPLFEELYNSLQQHFPHYNLSIDRKLAKQAHLLIHVVNSLLTACK